MSDRSVLLAVLLARIVIVVGGTGKGKARRGMVRGVGDPDRVYEKGWIVYMSKDGSAGDFRDSPGIGIDCVRSVELKQTY